MLPASQRDANASAAWRQFMCGVHAAVPRAVVYQRGRQACLLPHAIVFAPPPEPERPCRFGLFTLAAIVLNTENNLSL